MKRILAGLLSAAAVLLSAGNSVGAIPTSYPTGSGPASVTYGANGQLAYTYEANGDTIPDYSVAGYGGGGVTIPTVAVVTTLNAPSGDATTLIQNAINALAAQPLGSNGFRGAIKLNAGVYNLSTALTINASGIVLRGVGSGPTGTILRRTASNGDAVTADNGGGLSTPVAGTQHNITTTYVPVGATWFALDSTAGLAAGDPIMVHRTTTDAWVANLPDTQRTSSSYGNDFDCTITEIDGNRIRIDSPIMLAIDAGWGGGYVYKYTWASRLSNIGLEDIRADAPGDNVDADGNTDGNFMTFSHVINGWMRRCYNDRMRGHTASATGSKFITIEDVTSYHGGSGSHSGPSIQNFTSGYSTGLLFHRLTSTRGGFEFACSSHDAGPIVFCESQIPDGYAASEPHQASNAGLLYDADQFGQSVSVQYNSHGWTAFNALAWNSESTGTFNYERPATTHQWLQGCSAASMWNPASHGSNPEVLSWGTHLEPGCLYRAQLAERVGQDQANSALGAPDGSNFFYLDPSTTTNTVAAGQGASYPITMTTAPRYAGQTVTFSVSGLPAGAGASFSAPTRTSAGSTTLAVTTSGTTPAGTYTLRVIGSGTFPTNFGPTNPLNRSAFVTLVVTAAGGATTFEAESQIIAATSGDTYSVNTESGYSNGQAVQYNATGAGDYLTFRLPNIGAGTYSVIVGYKSYTSRGIVQVSAGPAGGALTNIGAAFDEYSSPSAYTSTTLGNWTATTTGSQDFKFSLSGHNASSSGYSETIDYIKLVPVAQPALFETEGLAISGSSGDTSSINSESGASGGQYVMYNSNGTGDYLTFTLPNIAPGTYTLAVGVKAYTTRAIAQTNVGPAGGALGAIGSPVDLYRSTSSFTELPIGTWTIGSPGDKSVQFQVTGKNASSSGYTLAIDYLKLTPQ